MHSPALLTLPGQALRPLRSWPHAAACSSLFPPPPGRPSSSGPSQLPPTRAGSLRVPIPSYSFKHSSQYFSVAKCVVAFLSTPTGRADAPQRKELTTRHHKGDAQYKHGDWPLHALHRGARDLLRTLTNEGGKRHIEKGSGRKIFCLLVRSLVVIKVVIILAATEDFWQ